MAKWLWTECCCSSSRSESGELAGVGLAEAGRTPRRFSGVPSVKQRCKPPASVRTKCGTGSVRRSIEAVTHLCKEKTTNVSGIFLYQDYTKFLFLYIELC